MDTVEQNNSQSTPTATPQPSQCKAELDKFCEAHKQQAEQDAHRMPVLLQTYPLAAAADSYHVWLHSHFSHLKYDRGYLNFLAAAKP